MSDGYPAALRRRPRASLALAAVSLLVLGACRARPVTVPAPEVTATTEDLTPLSATGDTSWRAAARHDARGKAADSVASVASATRASEASPASATGTRFADITPATIDRDPVAASLTAAEGPGVLRAQILLDRAHFSVGVLDAVDGQNTQKAVYFFQDAHGLPATGHFDVATYDALVRAVGAIPGSRRVALDEDVVRGPYVLLPGSVYEQAKLDCLCYQIPIEMLAERYHTAPPVLHQLNPGVDFMRLAPGDSLWVPNVEPFDIDALDAGATARVARIHISKRGEYVHALAADGSILFHFPTTVGSKYNPSPSGTYKVVGVEWRPPFRYDPTLYSEVPDWRPKALLPPGPNSPVGVVWIALSREHVGIHGTPRPDTIGLASSHGCVRLTNWDAVRLARSVRKGVPVEFGD